MAETPSSGSISPGLQRIAELARRHPQWAFTTLAHHIDLSLLREAYRRTRKDGAVGVDGQRAQEYGAHLEVNLQSLLGRLHTGTYEAPPVRRTYISKGDGRKERAIGIPTFEDKVLQRAVSMVLEAVYEADFLECSYGFRPGRSAHQALQALWKGAMSMDGGWIVEVDIQTFFDELDHPTLRGFLDRRVRDGVMRRIVHKWLKAGVFEEGTLRHPDMGTPQGGVISPLLANIYLHEVLDVWFEWEVKPRLYGRGLLVRYADDVVVVFEQERDARRVIEVLPKRFGRFGLRVHPDKTRVVRFTRPARRLEGRTSGSREPDSFDFLGFTHYWGESWKGRRWVVKRRTAKGRFTRAIKAVRVWCRNHRHLPPAEQHVALSQKLRGHFSYYGITGNSEALARFWWEVQRIWHKWLGRRSQRGRLSWEHYRRFLARYPLPPPRVVHSIYYPSAKSVA